MQKVSLTIICEKITNPRPWKYEASMIVFGKKRFLTFADSEKGAKKTALRRMKSLLLKTPIPD